MSKLLPRYPLIAAAIALVGLSACASKPPASAAPPATASDAKTLNFGFPLGFSPEKMDTTAEPRKDFRRYAAGRWLDAAKLPADSVRTSSLDIQIKLVELQVVELLDDAKRNSLTAPKGKPFAASGRLLRIRHG